MNKASVTKVVACVLLACTVLMPPAKAEKKEPKVFKGPVKVFLMAGQSNIAGYAGNPLLEYQANAPETKEFFAQRPESADDAVCHSHDRIQRLERTDRRLPDGAECPVGDERRA